ncbi:MAG TPA: maltose alpha-D-glucosyltransferase [Candidatus Angelobacter sp.]|nr:maltose alpha-D-glucosyltransferase [Candidatus Angelobacter sp.]
MAKPESRAAPEDLDPLWYKSAIIYEVPVRAFFDSNADGIGDFRGLTQKLDYIQDLGVTALWLLPFYPSPLKDDGYDIADYYSINPIYGTLSDFKAFMREAKVRGLRVITELVLNHTSDQHPWFQRSRRAPKGSKDRNFYVWSDAPEKYKEARIIFKDFEPSNWTWDPLARQYYWHRFYSHQPDLNFDNPAVHREILRIFEFWMDLGVDGFRLDAVPYLYEREGTSCESLPETHNYLKQLRAHLDAKYGDRMLLAEANQWPEEAVTFFGAGKGDECHMAFHFPLMPRLFMAVRLEDRIPITDILDQTPQIPETSQWALFLRNHDELTLEMVTDEERDYMYRVYASEVKARLNLGIRRRLAPLLKNDRKRIELLNLLLLSLPGTPVIYYGDEIGMGDNIFLGDRNGVRTPMHWSADKNAGFSRCTPQAIYAPIILDPEYHYEAVNVETQQNNQHSLLWWTRRVLALRKRWKVFGFGSLQFVQPENRKVLAFIRRHEDQTVLVIANLSRFPQPVELDLSAFQGYMPVELFGRTEFPPIGAAPYPFTMSPHSALWFSLEPVAERQEADLSGRLCKMLVAEENWEELVVGKERDELEVCLPSFLQQRRWFTNKGEIKSARIRDLMALPRHSELHFAAIVTADYAQSEPEEYFLPLAFASGAQAEHLEKDTPAFVFAREHIQRPNIDGVIYDASAGKDFGVALFELIARRRTISSEHTAASLSGWAVSTLRGPIPEPSAARTEERNTIVVYGDKYILKLFRRLESGMHPALESARFLADKNFQNVPPLFGALELERPDGEHTCVGILSGFVPNATRGWEFTQDALRRYYERVRTLPSLPPPDASVNSLVELAAKGGSDAAVETIGTYFESARLLGQRVGELHLALSSDPDNRDFAPEPFTPFYQRSLYQSLRNHLAFHFRILRRELKRLSDNARPLAEKVLGMQDAILARYRAVHQTPMTAMRIRCHGNFHLGHVLHTGKDFYIIDFEGEPGWTLSQRRIKRSPLRDIAGMIRSLHYVSDVALRQHAETGNLNADQLRALQPWARHWETQISADFLGAYLKVIGKTELLPKTKAGLAALLEAFLLDQAVIEMSRELQHRAEVIRVPLEGILHIIAPAECP